MFPSDTKLGVKKVFTKTQWETAVLDKEMKAESRPKEAGTCVLSTFVSRVIRSTLNSGSETASACTALAKMVSTTKRS